MIRFEYVLLEAVTIPVVLGLGGFLMSQFLSDSAQLIPLFVGSLLLGTGAVLTYALIRNVSRLLHTHPRQG
jgi:hypothetical protein